MPSFDLRVIAQQISQGQWDMRVEAPDEEVAEEAAVQYVGLALEAGELLLSTEGPMFKVSVPSEELETATVSVQLLEDAKETPEVVQPARSQISLVSAGE